LRFGIYDLGSEMFFLLDRKSEIAYRKSYLIRDIDLRFTILGLRFQIEARNEYYK